MELCVRGQAGFSGVYASGAVTVPLFVTGSILLMAIAMACVGAAYLRIKSSNSSHLLNLREITKRLYPKIVDIYSSSPYTFQVAIFPSP